MSTDANAYEQHRRTWDDLSPEQQKDEHRFLLTIGKRRRVELISRGLPIMRCAIYDWLASKSHDGKSARSESPQLSLTVDTRRIQGPSGFVVAYIPHDQKAYDRALAELACRVYDRIKQIEQYDDEQDALLREMGIEPRGVRHLHVEDVYVSVLDPD